MPNAQLQLLSATRLTGIMEGMQDPRLMPPQLVWRRRIPMVDAADDEIMARFVGQVLIADIVADDAKAAVYSMGKFQFETHKVPNLKMGIAMNQSALNALQRIEEGTANTADRSFFEGWENRTIENVQTGVDLRIEALLVSMLTDGLSYDRLGIKMNNVTWGMPSDLKVTPSVAWDSPTAKPVTDVQTLRRIARVRYGINLNRMSASSSALQYAYATTEYQDQARTFGFGFQGIPAPAIPLQSDAFLRQIFERILGDGMTIEVDDRRYWTQDVNGLITSQPFLPITKVMLTDSGNDNNPNAYDFANGVVTESIVGARAGIIDGFTAPVRGPAAYATGEHNPPSLTYWGVGRGFPRKHLLQGSALLNVGEFTDTIAVGVPFPA